MGQKTITLEIPDELYALIQEAAEANQCSIETFLLEKLEELFRKPLPHQRKTEPVSHDPL